MNPQEIETTVKTFILNEYLPGEDPAAFTETTPLMTTGILDSIAVLKVVTFLENQFGIMKAGAAYVPVDPTAPASRNAFIFCNCAVTAVIVEARLAEGLRQEFNQGGSAPELIVLDGSRRGSPAHAGP